MATLAAVVDQLKEQNENLSFVKDALESEAKARVSAYRREEAARKRALEDKREADAQRAKDARDVATQPQGFGAGVVQGLGEATGFTGLRNLLGPLVGAVFGTLFGGASIAALKTRIGKMVGRGLIFGPAILLLETFGSEIVQSLLTEMSDQFSINLTEEQKKSIADTAINAIDTGLLLSIFFGKKGFKAGIIGSLLSDTIKYITGQPDSFWTSKFEFAGMETPFTNEALLTAGSLVAAYFGPSLLYGAITQGLGGKAAFAGANVGRDKKGRFTKLKPSLATKFRTGFVTRLGPALIIATVGNAMADYISNEFGESAGDVASWTMNGVAVGSLFGPTGAILGGLAGLAIAGASALGAWLRSKDKEIRDGAVAAADQALADAGVLKDDGTIDVDKLAALPEPEKEEIATAALTAASELERAADPVGGLAGYAGNESMLSEADKKKIIGMYASGRAVEALQYEAAIALENKNLNRAIALVNQSIAEMITSGRIERSQANEDLFDKLFMQVNAAKRFGFGGSGYSIPEMTEAGVDIFGANQLNLAPYMPQQRGPDDGLRGGTNVAVDASNSGNTSVTNNNQAALVPQDKPVDKGDMIWGWNQYPSYP